MIQKPSVRMLEKFDNKLIIMDEMGDMKQEDLTKSGVGDQVTEM